MFGDALNGDTEQTNDNSVEVSNRSDTRQTAEQEQEGCGSRCDKDKDKQGSR